MKNNGVMKQIYLYFREKTEKGEFSSKKDENIASLGIGTFVNALVPYQGNT